MLKDPLDADYFDGLHAEHQYLKPAPYLPSQASAPKKRTGLAFTTLGAIGLIIVLWTFATGDSFTWKDWAGIAIPVGLSLVFLIGGIGILKRAKNKP